MSNGTALEWLINPHSNNSTSAWSIYFGRADRGTGDVYWGVGVRPTFYLDASLDIISGNGTKDNPYVVK